MVSQAKIMPRFAYCRNTTSLVDAGTAPAPWSQMPRKHCSGNTHSAAFTDLPAAEAACAKMGGACGGVYDSGCRFGSSSASRSVQIYLCKGGAALSTSSSSCVYTAITPPGAHQDQLRVQSSPQLP